MLGPLLKAGPWPNMNSRMSSPTWTNPVTLAYNRMTGRQVGGEIIQEYRDEEGTLCQWMFTDITPNSFHWIGRSSKDEGKTWETEAEFFMERVTTVGAGTPP